MTPAPRPGLAPAPCSAAMALLLAVLPPAGMADTAALYPPSTCAALWEGFADRFGDSGERALASRFRDASVAAVGAAETDALVAERRPWIGDLLEAYVLDGDDQSRDLFERLVRGCGEAAADLPAAP